jgi:hypothetical protein
VIKQPVNHKRILIIVPSILILFVTIIETGLVNTNLFRSRIKSSIKTKWESKILTGIDDCANEEKAREKAYRNNGNRQTVVFRNATIIAEYDHQTYTIEVDTSYVINVNLSTFNPGTIWTPLIKKASFDASAEINQDLRKEKAINNRVSQKFCTLGGKINITGTLSIVGLCSYKYARKLLLQTVLKNLAEAVRAEVIKADTY